MEKPTPEERKVRHQADLDKHVAYYSESVYKDIEGLGMSHFKGMAKLRKLDKMPIHYECQSKVYKLSYVYEGDVSHINHVAKCVGLNEMVNEVSRLLKEIYAKPDVHPWNAIYFNIVRDAESVHFSGVLCFFFQSKDDLVDEVIDELASLKGKEDAVRVDGLRKVAYSLLCSC